MSNLNGATKREPAPLAIYFVGGKELIGRRVPVEEKTSALLCAACAKREHEGREVTLSPVYEHAGALLVGEPNAAGEAPIQSRHVVRPLSGLVSLRSLSVRADFAIHLSDLDPREAKDLEEEYERCHQLVGGLRAQLAGIAQPRGPSGLILPGGRS